MQDFLNAKSMVTPGVAGGLIMLISNTFAIHFNVPAKWTALALSALLGLLVVCILTAPFWQKTLLWIFNAAIIFSMAIGTNQAGTSLDRQPKVPAPILLPDATVDWSQPSDDQSTQLTISNPTDYGFHLTPGTTNPAWSPFPSLKRTPGLRFAKAREPMKNPTTPFFHSWFGD